MFFEPSQDSQQTDTEDCSPDSRVTAALDELDIPYHYLPKSQKYEIHMEVSRLQAIHAQIEPHALISGLVRVD